jgi:hypothetical protein
MAAAKPKTRELASMEMAAWQAHIMQQAAVRVMMQSELNQPASTCCRKLQLDQHMISGTAPCLCHSQ